MGHSDVAHITPTPLPFVLLLWSSARWQNQYKQETAWIHNPFDSTLCSHTTNTYSSAFSLSIPSDMASSVVYPTQVSVGRYPHAHGHGITSSTLISLRPTLVNEPRNIERPSIELTFSSSGAKIINANVVGPADRPLYFISSDSKCTKLLSQRDNTEVATVEWDHSSPRMVLRGKKMKCKEWLPLAGPETEYVLMTLLSQDRHSDSRIRTRLLVHGDTQFTWMQQSSGGFVSHCSLQL